MCSRTKKPPERISFRRREGRLSRQHADEGDKFGKPQRGEQKNAAKVRLFHAQGRDVQHAEQKKSRRIDRCAVQAEILRGKIKKRRRKGGGRDRHAEVAAAVFCGFSLPLFLCHVEVGEANERTERKKTTWRP